MINLGKVRPGSTIDVPFSTFASSTGASATVTGYAAADIIIYKDAGTTERASTAGVSVFVDFDTRTGLHLATIDLSDNTTAGFYTAGSRFMVALADVTVDTQNIRTWLAMFRIGYDEALFDTTIATLSSQTSFTLTSGPAEDNALVGCPVVIHDIASAVQCAVGYITAYTGATKTVTLATAPTFTIAAGDNISVMPRTNVHAIGGTVQTARDIGASVLISSGTGTGQLSVTSGVISANVTQYGGSAGTFTGGRPEVNATHWGGTAVASAAVRANAIQFAGQTITCSGGVTVPAATLASTTNITSASGVTLAGVTHTGAVIPTVTSVTNRVSANVDQINGTSIAGTGSQVADRFVGFFNQATIGHTVATAISTLTAADVWNYAGGERNITDIGSAALAAVADAVWDEAISGHLTAGTTGNSLNAAGSAGDPWSTTLPGTYGSGTAGKIIGDNLNATVSSRLAAASYTAPLDAAGTRTAVGLASANLDTQLSTINSYIDTEVAAIKAKTDLIAGTPAVAGDAMTLTVAERAAVADKLLGRNLAGGSDGGRTVRQALAALRNKITFLDDLTFVVTAEDDTTTLWSGVYTKASVGYTVSAVDPG